MHTCNLSTRRWREEDQKFKVILTHVQSQASLGSMRLCLKKTKGGGRREEGQGQTEGLSKCPWSFLASLSDASDLHSVLWPHSSHQVLFLSV